MKKFYYLLTLVLSTFTFAQNPIITMIADCGCTGGTPKVLEIYAKGTVDFTQYTLQNQTNANTTWGADFDLSPLGTLTNTFVYIYYDGTNDNFFTEYPNAIVAQSLEASTMNLNGDDRVRIIKTSNQVVIDQFGVSDVDGTGTTWEWLDSYAKRNNNTGPDAGFTQSNWTFAPVNSTDNQGLCNSSTAFGVFTGAGTYVNTTLGVSDLNKTKSAFLKNTFVENDEIIFGSEVKDIKIYTLTGQLVKTSSVKANETLNVAELAKGNYIVTGTVNNQPVSQKILKD